MRSRLEVQSKQAEEARLAQKNTWQRMTEEEEEGAESEAKVGKGALK